MRHESCSVKRLSGAFETDRELNRGSYVINPTIDRIVYRRSVDSIDTTDGCQMKPAGK